MRYSEDHKAQTHQRIIDEASERFRRDGVGVTGLQPLMKALGLTHGGFYAHFKSKDDLVEQALNAAVEKLAVSVDETFAGDNPLQTFIRHYLSASHRANPGMGCPMPTLCSELGQRGQPSPTTDRMVESRVSKMAEHLEGPDAEQQSIAMLSTMVGALMLSRSVTDPELSDRILKGARQQLLKHVEGN
ncbi:TetR/AcrR family transcriptional regulator [Pseudomonas sp. GV071]|uniref:TetR/AcrR family transcriptional regulator n=1 Tax=Pseudomonas sp. GV071 TaxID=2135754 RepID=UPI000D390D25|nr:TetR/AcrR family transcriptional regulator [Pseudomonas sp. GV071]PTQ73971.1 TetR family transcriptional regulator [Pseudomonas sp. GV071]